MLPRLAAHLSGMVGLTAVLLFLAGLTVPPADEFPDSLVGAFHTFFVGVVVDQEGLPNGRDSDWMARAEPGDVVIVARGHVAWGAWSHAAVVVRAPADAVWVEPGTLAVLDASIHDGMYLSPLETYADWPRVVLLRASEDPDVRRRIAEAALAERRLIFASVVRPGGPYTNCTNSVVDALASVGLDAGLTGWGTPDELIRSDVWLR